MNILKAVKLKGKNCLHFTACNTKMVSFPFEALFSKINYYFFTCKLPQLNEKSQSKSLHFQCPFLVLLV